VFVALFQALPSGHAGHRTDQPFRFPPREKLPTVGRGSFFRQVDAIRGRAARARAPSVAAELLPVARARCDPTKPVANTGVIVLQERAESPTPLRRSSRHRHTLAERIPMYDSCQRYQVASACGGLPADL